MESASTEYQNPGPTTMGPNDGKGMVGISIRGLFWSILGPNWARKLRFLPEICFCKSLRLNKKIFPKIFLPIIRGNKFLVKISAFQPNLNPVFLQNNPRIEILTIPFSIACFLRYEHFIMKDPVQGLFWVFLGLNWARKLKSSPEICFS